MLEAYLRDLEREMSRSLSGDDLQARLAEAEAHLRDGIEARLELGLLPEEAECEAIATYGEAPRLVRAEPHRSAFPRLCFLLAGYGLAVVLFLGTIRFVYPLPHGIEGVFAVWIALGAAFAIHAFRSRRVAPVAVLGAGLAGSIVVWIVVGLLWIDLAPYGGKGVLPPGESAATLRANPRLISERSADLASVDAAMRTLRRPQGIEGMRSVTGYLAPVERDYSKWGERLVLSTVRDPKKAEAAWRDAARGNRWRDEVRDLRGNLAAVREAQAAPTGENLINVVPSILLTNVGVAGLAVLVDLVFGGLGALAFTLRRGRQGGGLRA